MGLTKSSQLITRDKFQTKQWENGDDGTLVSVVPERVVSSGTVIPRYILRINRYPPVVTTVYKVVKRVTSYKYFEFELIYDEDDMYSDLWLSLITNNPNDDHWILHPNIVMSTANDIYNNPSVPLSVRYAGAPATRIITLDTSHPDFKYYQLANPDYFPPHFGDPYLTNPYLHDEELRYTAVLEHAIAYDNRVLQTELNEHEKAYQHFVYTNAGLTHGGSIQGALMMNNPTLGNEYIHRTMLERILRLGYLGIHIDFAEELVEYPMNGDIQIQHQFSLEHIVKSVQTAVDKWFHWYGRRIHVFLYGVRYVNKDNITDLDTYAPSYIESYPPAKYPELDGEDHTLQNWQKRPRSQNDTSQQPYDSSISLSPWLSERSLYRSNTWPVHHSLKKNSFRFGNNVVRHATWSEWRETRNDLARKKDKGRIHTYDTPWGQQRTDYCGGSTHEGLDHYSLTITIISYDKVTPKLQQATANEMGITLSQQSLQIDVEGTHTDPSDIANNPRYKPPMHVMLHELGHVLGYPDVYWDGSFPPTYTYTPTGGTETTYHKSNIRSCFGYTHLANPDLTSEEKGDRNYDFNDYAFNKFDTVLMMRMIRYLYHYRYEPNRSRIYTEEELNTKDEALINLISEHSDFKQPTGAHVVNVVD